MVTVTTRRTTTPRCQFHEARALRHTDVSGLGIRRRGGARSLGFSSFAGLRPRPAPSAFEMISRRGGILDVLWIVACLDSLVSAARPQNFSRRPSTEADKEERVLSRQKRYLIFPQGSNVQLAYCLTIGAYNPYGSDNLVIGMTAALAWELPSKADHTVPDLLHRRSRSVVYPKIEALLQSVGLDGRSCVMRALCEAGQRDESEIGEGTFVQELLHAIFTLPKDGSAFESVEDRAYDYAHETREDCAALYSTCDRSIYDVEF